MSKGVEATRDVAAEKLLSSQWKIRPTIKTEIKTTTGMSPEEFALKNNLVGKDVESTLSNADAFKIDKINEKLNAIADWGTVDKTPAQNEMALSLKKALEKSLSETPEANSPTLTKLVQAVDDFVATEKPKFAQLEALKSLYDHYNPDGLEWDIRGKPVNPLKHENAAYRREQVQKLIEEEGTRKGIDIKQINKDIQGANKLAKGLGHAQDRMESHNIIGLGDTQIAIMGSVMG